MCWKLFGVLGLRLGYDMEAPRGGGAGCSRPVCSVCFVTAASSIPSVCLATEPKPPESEHGLPTRMLPLSRDTHSHVLVAPDGLAVTCVKSRLESNTAIRGDRCATHARAPVSRRSGAFGLLTCVRGWGVF